MIAVQFWSLTGYPEYEEVRRLQLALVESRIEDRIPDTVLFLEHSPVITRGRGLQHTGVASVARPKHMPLGALPEGIQFSETERGGDLTYHGPGQLVIYPICRLDGQGFGPKQDIGIFLRHFEAVLIRVLAKYGLAAESRPNATGVWVSGRKLASIGIAVRKWVTYHGMAINCVNDLSPFHSFSPCGFDPEIMTRLVDLGDFGSSGQKWRDELQNEFAGEMGAGTPAASRRKPILSLSLADAAERVSHASA